MTITYAEEPRSGRGGDADYRKINGWGADLDPAMRPAVPKEIPSDVKDARGPVNAWQQPKSKIHVSIEQPGITPVFGTACPPRGLSGLLRDYAFRFSEGRNAHWMTLILADRIDMIEGIIEDIAKGHPPNWVKEKGWKAHLHYGPDSRRQGNRKTKALVAAGAAGLAVVALAFLLRGDDD